MRLGWMLLLLPLLLLAAGCKSAAPSLAEMLPRAQAAAKPSCSKVGCSGHEDTAWGYCHWQTQQTGKTFLAWLEIGIKRQQSDPSSARCTLPFPAGGGNIATLTGNVDYRPMGHGLSSMEVAIGTSGGAEEYLWAGKMTAMPPASTTVAVHADYPHPLPAAGLVVWFYDDLDKPTTIHVAVAGTFQ